MEGPFLWNEEKSNELLRRRGLSFQMVVEAMQNGNLLDNLAHPDPMRPHQRIFIVRIEEWVCVVPYVIDGEVKFLKTIYPSRKHQLIYGG
jgi:uncharacterized DUF497 family protein